MSEVKAIKNPLDIELISREFSQLYGLKMESIWNLGLQVALRISDLLPIKYSDIDGDRLKLVEQKTGKTADIKLNNKAQQTIKTLRAANPDDIYLFQATGRNVSDTKPFSRQYVTKCFAVVGKSLKLELGTHSMRKTRGYHLYKKTNNIAKVMKMLRHSSESVTLRYIGITQEDIDADFDSLEL